MVYLIIFLSVVFFFVVFLLLNASDRIEKRLDIIEKNVVSQNKIDFNLHNFGVHKIISPKLTEKEIAEQEAFKKMGEIRKMHRCCEFDSRCYKYIFVSITYWLCKQDEIDGKRPHEVTYLGKRYLDMLYVVSEAVNDFISKYGITCEFSFEFVVSGYREFTVKEIKEAVKIIDCPEFKDLPIGSEYAFEEELKKKENNYET